MSYLELEAKEIFDANNVDYVHHYRPRKGCRFEFDFHIPLLNLLLELDGEFWHFSDWAKDKKVPEKDARKEAWAMQHGYRIVRIREQSVIDMGMRTCLKKIIKMWKAVRDGR